ncbi:MAG: alpha/beta fold hydrolase [Planctomycetota bacterium]
MIGNLRNAQGEALDCSFHEARAPGPRRLLVLGHGVTANKDRPFLVALAGAAAAAGIDALRFSFAGNGSSQGRFEDATVTKEVADLGAVLDAAEAAGYDRVAYAGHSMGGAVGVLRASVDPRITTLLSLAGMVHTQAFARRKFGDQRPGASLMWDKPECPLSQAYMDDMAAIGSVLDRVDDVVVPWLLVHGDADTVVPLADSEDVVARARPGRARLEVLPGADHVFGSDDATRRMVEVATPWLVETL